MWWEDHWPTAISDHFQDHLGNTLAKSYVFPANSDIEEKFLKQAQDNGVYLKKEIVRDLLSKSTIKPDSFGYVITDRPLQHIQNKFMSLDNICGGNSNYYCDQGKVQAEKIVLETSKMSKLDIYMSEKGEHMIVSNRLYKLIKNSDIQGVKFVPCLTSVKNYSEDEIRFESLIDEDDCSFDYMQMLPEESIKNPPVLDWGSLKMGAQSVEL